MNLTDLDARLRQHRQDLAETINAVIVEQTPRAVLDDLAITRHGLTQAMHHLALHAKITAPAAITGGSPWLAPPNQPAPAFAGTTLPIDLEDELNEVFGHGRPGRRKTRRGGRVLGQINFDPTPPAEDTPHE